MPLAEQPAKRTDDRVDRLTAQGRQAIENRHPPAKARGFESRRHPGYPGSHHADINGDMLRCFVLPANDLGIGSRSAFVPYAASNRCTAIRELTISVLMSRS